MKDIKCKCSHLKSEHKKTFWGNKFCNVCQCEEYLRFDAPTKWDKISFIYGIMMTAIVILAFGAMVYSLSLIPEESLNGQIEITLGQFLNIIIVIAVLFWIIILNIIIPNHISDYFVIKRRRTF